MELNLRKFYQACNPSKTLDLGKDEDKPYYIDFASVRGGEIIQELGSTITLLAENQATCQLFTGHIGCGKSTELLRLKTELEAEGFYVVYFESSQDLDLFDVRISDIMLAIAGRIAERLEDIEIKVKPRFFEKLIDDTVKLLHTPIELSGEFSLPFQLAKITAKTKESPQERNQIREYLETRTSPLLESINQEIIAKANQELKRQGKQGLVVIVDNLDRVGNRELPSGRTQAEYLFIDQGNQLGGLKCHVVYTIPLPLLFCSEFDALKQRLRGGVAPKVLPMVPTQLKDGKECEEGMQLLRQMVMCRAFPRLSAGERINRITEIFDTPDTLDRLCRISGGHVRNLMGLLFSCCLRTKKPPITRDCLERVIREERNQRLATILESQWDLLRRVQQTKKIVGSNPEYLNLLRSLLVYEYRNDNAGHWFDINPILAEAAELQ